MPTPNRYHDRHILDTCRGCWKQGCYCRQKADAALVGKTLVFMAAAIVLASIVGAGQSLADFLYRTFGG